MQEQAGYLSVIGRCHVGESSRIWLSLSRNDMKVLDVGSEECAVTNAISNFGNDKNWEVFGIDISEGLPRLLEDKYVCNR